MENDMIATGGLWEDCLIFDSGHARRLGEDSREIQRLQRGYF